MKKHKNNYINNKLFQEAMLEYYHKSKFAKENGQKEPIASDYIGKCILLIANRYITKPKFNGYSQQWKEEMMSDAIENCIKYGIKNYDPIRFSNPVAYFTEITNWAFIARIKTEKNEQIKKIRSQLDNEHLLVLSHNNILNSADNETANKMLREHEEKMSQAKVKKNIKKGIELFEKEE